MLQQPWNWDWNLVSFVHLSSVVPCSWLLTWKSERALLQFPGSRVLFALQSVHSSQTLEAGGLKGINHSMRHDENRAMRRRPSKSIGPGMTEGVSNCSFCPSLQLQLPRQSELRDLEALPVALLGCEPNLSQLLTVTNDMENLS
jgi:hypothetical protein